MKYTINSDFIAVADEVFIQPMDTCPKHVEVMLLSPGGNLTRGRWDGRSRVWAGWFPFPRRRKLDGVEYEKELEITHKEYL
jgi:hypothetical protein